MENLENIVLVIENIRKQILIDILIQSFTCAFIPSLIVFIITFFLLKYSLQRKYSFYAKEKIFNYIKNNPILKGIETIEYNKSSEIFKDILNKNYEFNTYKEEDTFVYKIQNVEIVMSKVKLLNQEIEITNKRRLRRLKPKNQIDIYIHQTILFQGIVYRIPKEYYKTHMENRSINETILTDANYVYILKEKNKDLFELNILKKVSPEYLTKFLQQLRNNLEFPKNYIKTS